MWYEEAWAFATAEWWRVAVLVASLTILLCLCCYLTRWVPCFSSNNNDSKKICFYPFQVLLPLLGLLHRPLLGLLPQVRRIGELPETAMLLQEEGRGHESVLRDRPAGEYRPTLEAHYHLQRVPEKE